MAENLTLIERVADWGVSDWSSIAVAVGTLTLAAATVFLHFRTEWKQTNDARRLALRDIWIPMRDQLEEVRGHLFSVRGPYPKYHEVQTADLELVVRHGLALAPRINEELAADMALLTDQLRKLHYLVGRFHRPGEIALDKVGQELSGDVGRCHSPEIEVRVDGRPVGTCTDTDLLNIWLHRGQLREWLTLLFDEAEGKRFDAQVRHEIHALPDVSLARLQRLVYERLDEADEYGIWDLYEEARLASERVLKELGEFIVTEARAVRRPGPQ